MQFTNNQFHTSQVLLSDRTHRTAKYCSHAVYGLAIALSVSTLIPSHVSQKLLNLGSAIALFAVSSKLDRLSLYASGYGVIGEQRSHVAYGDWLQASLKPPATVAIAQPPAPPDVPTPNFADIRESLKKPHLMLLGETGSGKSLLCKYLASEYKAPCIALDPHASPMDWQGAKVIGQGRNYQAIGEELARIVSLMDVRYKQRDQGVSQFAPLILIFEEFPAVASELGKDATQPVKLIVREGRKVNIKVVLMAQGSEVRTLGIEGEGSLRESFAVISLGKFARDRAKSLKDKQLIEAITQATRPAMIDDRPAVVPALPDTIALPQLPLPDDYLALTSGDRPVAAPIFSSAAPSFAMATQPRAQLAPVFELILQFLQGRDWTRDNYIKQSIRAFKDADTPITELQGYLQFLEVQGCLETRHAGINGIEARLPVS